MSTNDNEQITFEQALTKLEQIVAQLEKEDVPLEQMLTFYQEGMELSKICSDKLQHAEEKMTQILNDNNKRETFHMQEES